MERLELSRTFIGRDCHSVLTKGILQELDAKGPWIAAYPRTSEKHHHLLAVHMAMLATSQIAKAATIGMGQGSKNAERTGPDASQSVLASRSFLTQLRAGQRPAIVSIIAVDRRRNSNV
jgi:hypothetical protein